MAQSRAARRRARRIGAGALLSAAVLALSGCHWFYGADPFHPRHAHGGLHFGHGHVFHESSGHRHHGHHGSADFHRGREARRRGGAGSSRIRVKVP